MEVVAPQLKVARVIHAALCLGVGAFLGVAWFLRPGVAPRPELERLLLIAGAAVAITSVIASFVVPSLVGRSALARLAVSRPGASADEEALRLGGALLVQGIVGWALVEGPALFFGVVVLASGGSAGLGAMLALLVLLAARAPNKEGFDRFVREGGREITRLRSRRQSGS